MFFLVIALISLILTLIAALFVVIEIYVGVIGHIKGAPFVRSKQDRIETMMELAGIRPGMRVVDLGSGDGSVLIAAARLGASATGVEFNPFLVAYSRWKIKKIGLFDRITVVKKDFHSYPLYDADAVFVYLLPKALAIIAPRLDAELRPGASVVSNAFALPGWTPVAEKNSVRMYRKK